MFLLDTNICIYTIKQTSSKLLDKIQQEADRGIFISTLTIAELEYGIANSQYPEKNRLALMKFLTPFELLAYDEHDAISYGAIRKDLKQKGLLIGPMDLLLASQAISKKLILVTNNSRELSRVQGLQIQDWSG